MYSKCHLKGSLCIKFERNRLSRSFKLLISGPKIDLANQNFCYFSCNKELIHSRRHLKNNYLRLSKNGNKKERIGRDGIVLLSYVQS